jgi:hypothetical protein
MSDLNDLNALEIVISTRVEGGTDLGKTAEGMQNIAKEAKPAAEALDKVNVALEGSGDSGVIAMLTAQLKLINEIVKAFERRNDLIARSPAERIEISGQQHLEKFQELPHFGPGDSERVALSTALTAARQRLVEAQREVNTLTNRNELTGRTPVQRTEIRGQQVLSRIGNQPELAETARKSTEEAADRQRDIEARKDDAAANKKLAKDKTQQEQLRAEQQRTYDGAVQKAARYSREIDELQAKGTASSAPAVVTRLHAIEALRQEVTHPVPELARIQEQIGAITHYGHTATLGTPPLQGTYFSLGQDGLFKDFGPNKVTTEATGRNTLHIPGEENVKSTGVLALRHLDPETFERLKDAGLEDIHKEFTTRFPGADISKHREEWSALEGYGAQLARSKGYDSILKTDPDPKFSEYVALDRSAFGTGSNGGAKASQEAVQAEERAQSQILNAHVRTATTVEQFDSAVLNAKKLTNAEAVKDADKTAAANLKTAEKEAKEKERLSKQTARENKKAADEAIADEERDQAAIKRTLEALEKKARFAGANTPAQHVAANLEQAGVDLGKMRGLGATETEIGRAASAYEKLNEAISAVEIPLFQLSPVIGYQGAMLARLGVSVAAAASSMSMMAIVAGGTALAFAGIGIAAVLGANALGNYAREMKNLSEETGLSLEGAQRFQRVTEVMGVRAQAIVPGIQRMYLALAEGGEQSKKGAEAFEQLGVHARTLTGELRPMDELLPEVVASLNNMKDAATSNAIAKTLFGRSFNQIIPALKEYQEVLSKIEPTKVIVDRKTMEDASNFHTQLALLKDDWMSLVHTMETKAVGIVQLVMQGGKAASTGLSTGLSTPLQALAAGWHVLAPEVKSPEEELADRYQKAKATAASALAAVQTPAQKAAAKAAADAQYKANRAENEAAINQADIIGGSSPAEVSLEKAKKAASEARRVVEEDGEQHNAQHLADLKRTSEAEKSARDRLKGEKDYQTELKETQRIEREAKSAGLEGLAKLKADHAAKLLEVKSLELRARQADAFASEETGYAQKEANKSSDLVTKDRAETVVKALASELDLRKKVLEVVAKLRDSQRQLGDDPKLKHDFAQDRGRALGSYWETSISLQAQHDARLAAAKDLKEPGAKDKAVAEANKQYLDANTTAAKQYAEAILKVVEGEGLWRIEEEKRRKEAEKSIAVVQLQSQIAGIQRGTNLQVARLNSAAGPQDARRMAQDEYRIRLDGENAIAAKQLERVGKEHDVIKKAEESAHVIAEIDRARGELNMQYQEKLLAIQKQEMEEARRDAGDIFTALTDSKGAGAGLQALLKSKTMGVERTMFENVASPYIKTATDSMSTLIPGQYGADGKQTGLGKMLAGTPFASKDPAASPVVANTTATNDLVTINTKLNTTITDLNQMLQGNGAASTVTITGAGSNTNVILPGVGSDVSSLPAGFQSQTAAMNALGPLMTTASGASVSSAPAAALSDSSTLSGWMNAALGLGGVAALTTGGLAAAGVFNQSGFNITQRTPSVSKADGGSQGISTNVTSSAGPGLNVPQTVMASMTGLVGGMAALSKVMPANGSNPLGQLGDALKAFSNGPKLGIDGTWATLTGNGYSKGTFGTPGFISNTNADGNVTLGSQVGAAMSLATAGLGVTKGILDAAKGGAKNVTAGVGESLMAASPFTGPAAPFVAAAGMISTMISSFLPDPKQAYSNKVQETLQQNRWVAPATLNETVGQGGYDINYNKYGKARTIPYQGLQESQGYVQKDPYNSNTWLTVPSTVIQPGQYGSTPVSSPTVSAGAAYPSFTPAGSSGHNVTINVNAMDSKSIQDHAPEIGQAVFTELNKQGNLTQRVQSLVLGS